MDALVADAELPAQAVGRPALDDDEAGVHPLVVMEEAEGRDVPPEGGAHDGIVRRTGRLRRERRHPPGQEKWVSWEEGDLLPTLIIELVSPSTEKGDRGRKLSIYRDFFHCPDYFLYMRSSSTYQRQSPYIFRSR